VGCGLRIVDFGMWIAECGFGIWDFGVKCSITRLEARGATFLVWVVCLVVSVAVRGSKAISARFRGFRIAEWGLWIGFQNALWRVWRRLQPFSRCGYGVWSFRGIFVAYTRFAAIGDL